jgi:sphingosine kinase
MCMIVPTVVAVMRGLWFCGKKMEEKISDEPLMTIENKDQILLSDESGEVKYQNQSCLLSLTMNKLMIENLKKKSMEMILSLNDMIGVTITTEGKNSGKILELHLFAPPSRCCCNCFSSKSIRKLSTVQLLFPESQGCASWMNAINSLLRDILLTKSPDGVIQPPPTRRYLVFVNPVGGTGNAVQIWNRVQPFLTFASIEYELLITERANHAKDVMATRNLDDITAVVIVGGDGLIFEVVSGLFARSDSQAQLRRIIFAPIPGGSGNGLIKSILHESGEDYSPENAMFVAIRGKPSPLDLSQVTNLSLPLPVLFS